jgi:hypothetical protein
MATPVEPGNKTPLGSGGGENTPKAKVDAMVEKTKALAFGDEPVLELENFDHLGDRPAGTIQAFSDMQDLSGKELQESYRAGLSKSAEYTSKVSDR